MGAIIGTNIRNLIDENKINISEIADIIKVSRQTMNNYIKGTSIIDSEKLFIIAEYFNKPIEYFLEEEHNDELSFMFRAHNPQHNFDQCLKSKAENLMEKVYEVYKLSGEKYSYIPTQYNLDIDPNEKNLSKDIEKIIEDIANKERSNLCIGDTVGEDLIKCFEVNGIKIIFHPFNNSKIFGLSAYHNKKGCFILINDDPNIPEERKIFSIVHEYAHLIFSRDEYKKSQNELQYSNYKSDINEKIANTFASYFLIPRDILSNYDYLLRGKLILEDLIYIKKELNVSLQALIYALNNYGYIDDLTRKRTFELLYKAGLGTVEPEPMKPMTYKNERFKNMVRSLFIKGEIGVSKIAELLNIKIIEARKLAKEWMKDAREIQEFI